MAAELTENDLARLKAGLEKIGVHIALVEPERLVDHIEGCINSLILARSSGVPFIEYSQRRY